jgi:hypothetical protein
MRVKKFGISVAMIRSVAAGSSSSIAHGDELANGRDAILSDIILSDLIFPDAISTSSQTAAAKEERSQAEASEAALKK